MPNIPSPFRHLAVTAITLSPIFLIAGCVDSTHKSVNQTTDTLPEFSASTDASRGSLPAASGRAIATIASGTGVNGTVTFIQAGDHVTFVADISGLASGSQHDFYLARTGGSSSERDMKSNRRLGNLVADANGHAHLEGTVLNVSISDTNPIVNWSVVIPANPDVMGVVKLTAQ